MATLLLTAVGTAIGGPFGGALGALTGRQIDNAIFGSGSREGPRLQELSITTSSYGQPIARQFGSMRAPGTIIWATDLQETSEKSGGGKGKPKTTTYSYSASFAVALSSRPIKSIGRIWADGNLLRGSAGDLKSSGTMRVYLGHGDQQVDPLISSAENGICPAYRGCAYVVFDDLSLGDFGNRIPALTFEVIADGAEAVALSELIPSSQGLEAHGQFDGMKGFSDDGSPLLSMLTSIDRVYPMTSVTGGTSLRIGQIESDTNDLPVLPDAIPHSGTGSEATNSSNARMRDFASGASPAGLRYYDRERDYQPSVQRSLGVNDDGRERIVDLPAAMDAGDARDLCNDNALRARWRRDRLTWRVAELDPAINPGRVVKVPGQSGIWNVTTWEWLDRGVELSLDRLPPMAGASISGDAGSIVAPMDLALTPTTLRAFELPAESNAVSGTSQIFAAMSSTGSNWPGASLYLDQGGSLQPLDIFSRRPATMGSLSEPLSGSMGLFLERSASILIDLDNPDSRFESASIASMASGANRLWIDGEVVQFAQAIQEDAARWRLVGLLRGRGGTEGQSIAGHDAGAPVVLIDDRLLALDPSTLPAQANTQLAAVGLADTDPVLTALEATGISRNPLSPVHIRQGDDGAGGWQICWSRRARGYWLWEDAIDVPLVEESEKYQIGVGSTHAPELLWDATHPEIAFDAATIADLAEHHSGKAMWVRQIGTFGASPATFIRVIP